ncbi:heme-binding protein 2-like isoform X1 [Eucyclogobius newberryi]|uniref:heme-binding protein 2-like isoform X1 n=1 Tax=Eucyclogobius newberryi TaxID=166745 RepID=UPI003B59FD37
MMIYLAGLVGFLLVLTAQAGGGFSGPKCDKLEECLQFETICKNEDYEVRRYAPVKWICTSFSGLNWAFGIAPAFWRLKTYLEDNDVGMEIPGIMAMPADDPPPSDGDWLSALNNIPKRLSKTYSICFPPSSEHQSNPPKPADPKVTIKSEGVRYMYVRGYNDWVKDDTAQANLLFSSLNMASYEKSHYAVGYNSQMNPNPYSEVWVEADGAPQC